MPFAKESPFYHSFELALSKLREHGELDRIQREFSLDYKEQIQCGSMKVIVTLETMMDLDRFFSEKLGFNKSGLSIWMPNSWNHYGRCHYSFRKASVDCKAKKKTER